jgi:prolyl-tRNA editing enzyme YbaK/EbsC (Cys-tRNA(Pro) deacylase)
VECPFGHSIQLRVFVDPDLLQYGGLCPAAGTWNVVFGIEPHTLVGASGGVAAGQKRDSRLRREAEARPPLLR